MLVFYSEAEAYHNAKMVAMIAECAVHSLETQFPLVIRRLRVLTCAV